MLKSRVQGDSEAAALNGAKGCVHLSLRAEHESDFSRYKIDKYFVVRGLTLLTCCLPVGNQIKFAITCHLSLTMHHFK